MAEQDASQKPGLEKPGLPAPIERRVGASRLALFWERLWPALWPSLAILGLFTLAGLSGFLSSLPLAAHWLLWCASFAAAGFFLWQRRAAFYPPSREEALRRMEHISGLPHRPLSAFNDEAAEGTGEAALWAAHRAWIAEKVVKARVGLPRASLAAADPYALRAALVTALLVFAVILGPETGERLARTYWPGLGMPDMTTSVDAWVNPPAYTGRPPLFLAGAKGAPKGKSDFDIPEGSVLTLRVHGPGPRPAYALAGGSETAFKTLGENAYEAQVTLSEDTALTLSRASNDLYSWDFKIIPDDAPQIAFEGPLEDTLRKALRLGYEASDDYGLKSVQARMALGPSVVLQERTLFQTAGSDPLFERAEVEEEAGSKNGKPESLLMPPPVVELPLPRLRPKKVSQEVFRDLTAHPWAGLPVELWLAAEDDAGQTGKSETRSLTLPARHFKEPLAAAIAEQRRRLALYPDSRMNIAGFLSAFSQDLERQDGDMTVFLGLRAAYWRLTKAQHLADLDGVLDLLWDLALHIEDGDLSLAERDLRDAREKLAEALAEGASDEEIEAAMEALKSALARYLDALSEKMGDMAEQLPAMPQNPDTQALERSDLEKMLEAIGDLARTGAREQAQDMLSQLGNILENLQTGDDQNQSAQAPSALSEALNEMGELIGEQRELMDDTFGEAKKEEARPLDQQGRQGLSSNQQGSGQSGGNQSGNQQNGTQQGGARQGAQQGEGNGGYPDLRGRQQALRDKLRALMEELHNNGEEVPSALEHAQRAMDQADDRLKQGRAERATGAQGQAIDQLRAGAQSMANQMLERMAGGMARSGNSGQGNGNANTDPLGRPTRSAGPDFGDDVQVPDVIDAERAREILNELRRRAAEMGRPQIELDYLERLLRRF
ncbi:TIGR02302 family protein [Tepidicaulis sp.]|uniref:TIGR02302 family protein n=1 Tax=Tepidicaulis sp. TaxID=1920809 RepID=UPI003B594907